MPVVDVVVFFILSKDNIGVSIVELTVELNVLSNRLKLLNAVDFETFLTCSGKEFICFCLKLTNVDI